MSLRRPILIKAVKSSRFVKSYIVGRDIPNIVAAWGTVITLGNSWIAYMVARPFLAGILLYTFILKYSIEYVKHFLVFDCIFFIRMII